MGGKPHKLKWLEKYDADMAASRAQGQEQGRAEGRALEIKEKITYMLRRGKTVEEIVDFCGYPYEQVKEIEDSLLATARK